MSVLKDHYYKLSSELPKERIEAATALLSELSSVDKTEEWDYALSRLIKGLSTSRQTARFGFSMALTELVRELVLKENYDLSLSSFLDKVVDATQVSSAMKGKELRSVLFGRLFGFQALVNSGLLLEASSSQEDIQKFVSLLVLLSGAKSWLRESAMFTLCQFLGTYLGSDLYDEATLVGFLQSISDEELNFTTEGLAVYLVIPQPLRSIAAQQVTGSSLWKNGDPLSSGNLVTLAKVLKDVDVVAEDASDDSESKPQKNKNSKQKGTWSPRIPFVWEFLVKHFAAEISEGDFDEVMESSSKKRKKSGAQKSKKKAKTESTSISLKEFWKVVVDETMFAEKASSERKYWGFEVFNQFLTALPASSVSDLFTPNLMRCLINQSAQTGRLLNKISTKTINTIIEVPQKDLSKVVPVLTRIIDEANGGTWNFDPITKSKAVDALIGVLGYVEDVELVSNHQVDSLVSDIKDVLISKFEKALAEQDEPEATTSEIIHKKSKDNVLKWVLDKLLVLMRSTKRFNAEKSKLMETVFKFLIQHALFKKASGNVVSNNILKLVQDRLNSFLSEVISLKRKGHSWSLYCVKQIKSLEDDPDFELLLELDESLAAIRDEGLEMLSTIKDAMKHGKGNTEQQYCFELLFSMVLLQLYMGEAETVDVLEELKSCYLETFSGEDAEIDTSTVLTEIILSFVSRKSTSLKKLSTIVWESLMCTKDQDGKLNVNAACFKLLFAVLNTKENEEGQKALFEGEDEFGAEDEDEEEVEEDGEEEQQSEQEKEGDDADTEDSDDSSDESDDLTAKIDKTTNIKLAKALGIPTETSGEVKYEDIDSFGEDDDDYESESMDDEQMMAIDGELSRIFVERRNALSANNTNKKKAELMEAKENIILFKSRVLDLLESFSKEQPNSIYNLSFIQPIVSLMNMTTDKNLGTKAHKLLKTRVSKAKITQEELNERYPTNEDKATFQSTQLELLDWLQTQAGKYSSNHAHALACGQACIIISKALVALDTKLLETIINVYTKTLCVWATEPKNRIQASMFFDFINWLNAKRSN